MKHVNPDNTRGRPDGHYATVISEIAKAGVCPFCPENIANHHKNEITTKKFWLVTKSMYPYKPTKRHFLLIHREHISHVQEISKEAWVELQTIMQELTSANDIAGGSFMMRFGDTKFTGASVTHLHAHVIQSDPDSPDYNKDKGLLCRIG